MDSRPRIEAKYKRLLIRDSLVGAFYLLSDPEVFCFPFIDYLSLLHQRPLIFNFWDCEGDGDAPLFSTLADPEYLRGKTFEWQKAPSCRLTDRISLTAHSFVKTQSNHSIESVNKDDVEQLQRLFREAQHPLIEHMLSGLEESLLLRCEKRSNRAYCPEGIVVLDDYQRDVRTALEPMIDALDEILTVALQSKRLELRNNRGLSLPNIFPVFRCIRSGVPRMSAFEYTAGIVLLPSARQQIRTWADSLSDEQKSKIQLLGDPVDTLEIPIGPNSRSISDIVFASGVVDFGRRAKEGQWDIAGDEDDRKRQEMERLIYPQGKRLFYVPIHVGGTPWICFYTFAESPEEGWFHNYIMYRDVIHNTASQIRTTAEDVYISLVADAIIQHVSNAVNVPQQVLLDHINTTLRKLSQVYPLPLVQLAEATHSGSLQDNPERFYVPGRGVFAVTIQDNLSFRRQVEWGLGNKTKMRRTLTSRLETFIRREKAIVTSKLAQASHLIKTPLRRIQTIALSDRAAPKSLLRQIEATLHLGDAAGALASDTKRDSFLEAHRRRLGRSEFETHVNEIIHDTLAYLDDPLIAPVAMERIRHLRERASKGLLSVTLPQCPAVEDGEYVIVTYRALLLAILDGLLLNAATYGAEDNFCELSLEWEGTLVRFVAKNSTRESLDRVTERIGRLRCPSPDIVGVSEMHWISDACWRNSLCGTQECLQWSVEPNSSPPVVIAKSLVGIMENVK